MSASHSRAPDGPTKAPPIEALLDALCGRRVSVLTGAGCSTESGIPDYRGEGARHRPRAPIQHHEFVTRAEVRQRYWARSILGWPRFCSARPNEGHRALAALEQHGVVHGVLTQNVDGLHQAAGSARVLELHGALSRVKCLACGAPESRDALQHRLTVLNPGFLDEHEALVRPDGDAEIADALVRAFRVAECLHCGHGALTPDVVFFGGSVARPLVEQAYRWLDESDALLVLGTSLQVFSGFRFALRARDQKKPVLIVNAGPTRADAFATVRVEGRLGAVLPRVADSVRPRSTPSHEGPAQASRLS